MPRARALPRDVLRQRKGIGQETPKRLEADRASAFDRGAIARMFGGATRPAGDPTRKPKRQDRRWQRIQAEQLEREPYCRLCRAAGQQVPAVEVDHVQALADGGAFADSANLQSLCRPCHWQKTEDENAARARRKPRRVVRVKGCDLTGRPLDPEHWWNTQR
jgi:5-methylcytosine-specific restriction protein A